MKKKIIIITVIAVLAAGTIGVLSFGVLSLKDMKKYSGPTLDPEAADLGPVDAIGERFEKGPEISSATSPDTGSLEVQWNTGSALWDGYQLECSKTRGFEHHEDIDITDTTIMKATFKDLDSGKKYYVKLCAYRIDKNDHYYNYTTWSEIKSVKVK